MNVKVVNKHKDKYDIYCGRPSKYGNKFIIGEDGNRDEVIQKYKEYFDKRIHEDEQFRIDVLSLQNKTLGCYCTPKKCHVDIIADYLNNLLECPKCKRFSVFNNNSCEICEYPDCDYGDIFHIP